MQPMYVYENDLVDVIDAFGVPRETRAYYSSTNVALKADIYTGHRDSSTVNGNNISWNPDTIQKIVDGLTAKGYIVKKTRKSFYDMDRGFTWNAVTVFVEPRC